MISKNLVQRLLVAALAIPVIIFLIFRGGDAFLYFVLVLAALGTYEYFSNGGIPIHSAPFIISYAGILGAVYLLSLGSLSLGIILLMAVMLVTGIIQAMGKKPVDELFSRMVYIVWGSFYIGLLYPFIYLIRGDSIWMGSAPGSWWLFFLMGSLWLGDTAAMFIGSRFGRHKLASVVSPNKTVEGFLGGFLGVFIVAAIFNAFWITDIAPLHWLVLSVLIGLFGQLGDLVESLWKRSLQIKDSSAIIPGHGGVLDRFDSLLFAAPVLYLYLPRPS